MSGPKLTERIDMWVGKFDPTGVRGPRPVREDRYVEVGPISPGMAGIWAKLPMHQGAAFDTRLDQIAATVCRDDPRTAAQRRAAPTPFTRSPPATPGWTAAAAPPPARPPHPNRRWVRC